MTVIYQGHIVENTTECKRFLRDWCMKYIPVQELAIVEAGLMRNLEQGYVLGVAEYMDWKERDLARPAPYIGPEDTEPTKGG